MDKAEGEVTHRTNYPLRREISDSGANPNTTGWLDCEYVTSGT